MRGNEAGEIEVLGIFLQSFARACENLQLIAAAEASAAAEAEPLNWYPASRFRELFDLVTRRFNQPEPIKERIGVELMKLWYVSGGGSGIVSCAADFLRFQTSSEGYGSVVRGPPYAVGEFALERLTETEGSAVVKSSTPFDRSMERGVLLGGIQLAGELVYATVDNSVDPSVFLIRFH